MSVPSEVSPTMEPGTRDILIDAVAVSRRYEGNAGIRDVSLRLHEGEVVGVIGPSGGGKTTLLRCIELLEPIETGRITYGKRFAVEHRTAPDGNAYFSLHDLQTDRLKVLSEDDAVAIRRQVGYVSQRLNLWENRTVLENLLLAPRIVAGEERSVLEHRATTLSEQFGIADKLHRWPRQLSGGERQRVALLRALMMRPQVLLLDEVTSALDPVLTVEVMDAIKKLRDDGLAMIIVTHHIHFATLVCDRIAFISHGKLLQIDSPKALQAQPASDEVNHFLTVLRAAT